MTQTTDMIVLRQLPIIEEQLHQVKEQVEERVKEAVSLVCTEETRRDVKAVRATMRKEFDDLEKQRKKIKAEILAKYEEFEKVYWECVGAYRDADSTLKKKIDAVEDELKEEKLAEIKRYFEEARRIRSIPDSIAEFEDSGVKVTLSVSVSSMKKNVDTFLNRVAGELKYIQSLADADEIMVEYRKSLNMIAAVDTVTTRHEMMEAERQQRKAKEKLPVQPEMKEGIEEERLVSIAFRVTCTKVQIETLKAFLNSGEYRYNMIGIGGTGNG